MSIEPPYSVNSTIKLIYAQYPSQKKMDVVIALKNCGECWWVSDKYLSYYHPLKHGEYQLKERVKLVIEEGNIFIDLLTDQRIGGIEFGF